MLILYNKLNGKKAAAIVFEVANFLKDYFVSIEILALQEPKIKLEQAIFQHKEITISGGDGTFHQCINQFNFEGKILGFISSGSGNDFARQLYGTLNWKEQVQIILLDKTYEIDLLKVNDKLCLNNLGIGFDGAAALVANKLDKWLPSFLKYNVAVLSQLFTYKENLYSIKTTEFEIESTLLLASVANGTYAGGGYKLFPKASIYDELLDICLIKRSKILTRLNYLKKVSSGKHTELKIVNYSQQKWCTISTRNNIPYHMDGEVYFGNFWDIKLITSPFRVYALAD